VPTRTFARKRPIQIVGSSIPKCIVVVTVFFCEKDGIVSIDVFLKKNFDSFVVFQG
jgi:hypothetical protein